MRMTHYRRAVDVDNSVSASNDVLSTFPIQDGAVAVVAPRRARGAVRAHPVGHQEDP